MSRRRSILPDGSRGSSSSNETDAGALRFATLDDFKNYVANHKR